ncbi:diguanylate cyclase [Hydrogenimonas sp. SS33]|uniref:GGDEF domain-containing protein n=1 Tax=Hydrogenimonas leucolamina TaxID=2954236 RepID=UPI00336BB9B6
MNQLLLPDTEWPDNEKAIKAAVINAILVVIGAVLLFFISLKSFFHLPDILYRSEIFALCAIVLAYVDLNRTHNLVRAAVLASLVLMGLFGIVLYSGEGRDYILGWMPFLPVSLVFINGRRIGIFLSLLFFAGAFYLAYRGIGHWDYAHWNFRAFTRFMVVNLSMLAAASFLDRIYHWTRAMNREKKEQEKGYIRKLEEVAVTDPLTRIHNRRYLDSRIGSLFRTAKQKRVLFAFFIMDIDFFKRYNDTYGHEAGDRVLQRVSEALDTHIFRREEDLFCRLGGEEFGGVILGKSRKEVEERIEAARLLLRDLRIEHAKNRQGVVTASFGVCVVKSDQRRNFNVIYKMADEALYEAKTEGRDRVVVTELR